MFAKLCAKVCYPELVYCAWLATLPALVCSYGTIAVTLFFGDIGWFEILFNCACWSIPAALLGVLIGGVFNRLMPNQRRIWIFLSFFIPFQVLATFALLEVDWNVARLLSYGDFLLYLLGASSAASIVSISLRILLSATIPKVRGIAG